MIDFVSYMSKHFGDNPTLGEEFMYALVDTQWSRKTLFPFAKVALTVTSCTSSKVVDGVARLFTKIDIIGLRAKKFEQGLIDMENTLERLW